MVAPSENSDSGGNTPVAGNMTVDNCTISGNTASSGGGGIENLNSTLTVRTTTISGNSGGSGGGLEDRGTGTVLVQSCTLSSNTALTFSGGGIANDGAALTVRNCTISGNSAPFGGGGLNNRSGATSLDSSTIVLNRANTSNNAFSGGGGIELQAGSVKLQNSIVAQNVRGTGTGTVDDLSISGAGTLTSSGYNLLGEDSENLFTATGDQKGTLAAPLNPQLGALANNGGPTFTHLPQTGSPAINSGNTTLTVDQRGIARPQGAADDKGAVEVAGAVILPSLSINDVSVTEGPAPGAPAGTTSAVFTVTLSAASTQTVTVNFATANGTTNPATAPADYAAQSGTLSFAPGQTTKTITIAVVGDAIPEANETFFVNLSTPSNATISDAQGLGTIVNDDLSGGCTANNVVAWYRAEGNAKDSAGNHDGVLLNGATFTPGMVSRAFKLDGVDDYIQAPDSPDLDPTAEASLTAWVYFDKLPSEVGHPMAIITKSGFARDLDLQAFDDGNGINRFDFHIGVGGSQVFVRSNTAIQKNRWYHIVGTYLQNSALKIYVNGALENNYTGPNITRQANGNPLTIGENFTFRGRYFAGNIDEAQLYGRALTLAEIRGIYNSGISGACLVPLSTTPPQNSLVVDTISDANLSACTTAPNDCSLRGAITKANATTGANTITFNIPGTGIKTIAPATSLPALTDAATVIDGSPNPGVISRPIIVISGVNLRNGTGLNLRGANCTLRNLVVSGWEIGISIAGTAATGNRVQDCYIGTNSNATTAAPNVVGVQISAKSSGNIIGGAAGEGNIISGNSLIGVQIVNSNNNRLEGNTIGLNAAGTALSNGAFGDGIQILTGSTGNLVGGTTSGARNIISGNNGVGILISSSAANNVRGNYIGTNAAGNAAIANGRGIRIDSGATRNVIGGTTAAFRNVISGSEYGVLLAGATTKSNAILGNYVGLNAAGSAALSNRFGVGIFGAVGNTIGGTQSGARNIISGSDDANVYISENSATNSVLGNYIGTNVNGTASLGAFSTSAGVLIDNGANGNVIGGSTAAARNIISGNAGHGILILGRSFGPGALARSNRVAGNYIGLNAAGTAKIPNSTDGIAIEAGAINNVIGVVGGGRNSVAGSGRYGISMSGAGTNGNTVQNNWVGLNAAGTGVLGNDAQGIVIFDGAQRNRIGSDVAGTGNVVAGNGDNGISIGGLGGPTSGQNTAFNVVQGNFIGTDPTGKLTGFGNLLPGISLAQGTHDNLIGGLTPGARNVVSGNKSDGILLGNPTARLNRIQGNYIGLKADGSGALPNAGNGVTIANNAQNNIIGGSGGRNIISGNTGRGIFISDAATANVVQSNFIGTNVSGTAAFGNRFEGVNITNASGNLLGGATLAARNIISGNGGGGASGVAIIGATAKNNAVQGNFIGTNVTGTAAVPNVREGVFINAVGNTVGGVTNTPGTGAGNVISGNALEGVHLGTFFGGVSTGNRVFGNMIGLNAAGNAALPNLRGVLIDGGAKNNFIGTSVTGARNVISGNTEHGIYIADAGTTGNRVEGNFIGTNAAGTAALGNKFDGVLIRNAATNNTIGGTTAGARNIISGNGVPGRAGRSGVVIADAGTSGNSVLGNYIGQDKSGAVALGNTGNGVSLTLAANSNTIGGTTAGARNIISGNYMGVIVGAGGGGGGNNNSVLGNYVGTNAAGTAAIGNGAYGIAVADGSNHTITGNLVSGNRDVGILVFGSNANTIRTNLVGVAADGTTALGNVGNGIDIKGNNNIIGGVAAGQANTIAFNTGVGVSVQDDNEQGGISVGNSIRGNSIHDNGGLGIDLGLNGVSANDANDADGGANNLQNYPALTLATQSGAGQNLVLQGTLNSTAGRTFTVEAFANDAADPSGFGEGQTYLGSFVVGNGTFNQSLAFAGNAANTFISLTATDNTSGDSSEFSRAVLVTQPVAITVTVNPNSVTLNIGATQQFNATVTGTTNQNVIWSVDGGAANGTITAAGLYTAPATPGTYIVRATSVADNTVSGTATVTVVSTATGTPLLGWGYNQFGSVGDGSNINRPSPVTVNIIRNARLIDSGGSHNLAVAGNVLYAWGDNDSGQLGDGTRTSRNQPVVIALPTGISAANLKAIACGWYHSLALTNDNRVLAWGLNKDGQCGVTPDSPRYITAPRLVAGLANIAQIAGGTIHSLALDSNGKVWAWGNNFYGQLGNGTAQNINATPKIVANLPKAKSISAGAGHSIALLSDGTAKAWGWNFYGQLGDGFSGYQGNGDERVSAVPVTVKNVASGTQLSAGYAHNLILKSDGTLLSWGNNFYGQLGRSTSSANDGLAANVTDISGAVFGNVQTISAGSGHNLVIRSDGTIWSWGYNEFGSLGLGTTNNEIAPQQVPNLINAQAIQAGYAHSVAMAARRIAPPSRKISTTWQSGSAYASNHSVTLTFSGKLRSIAADGVRVLVNGEQAIVQSSSVSGNNLTILLPQGTLQAGDEVIVAWSQLQTQAGESLTGNSPVIVVE